MSFRWFFLVVFIFGIHQHSVAANSVSSDKSAGEKSTAQLTHRVTIQVSLPADSPPIFLAGNLPVLGPWHPAALPIEGSGKLRSVDIDVPHGHNLQYKVTAGSWEQEGLGPSATLLPNFSATITEPTTLTAKIAGFRKDPRELIADWRGSGVKGSLHYWTDMPSKFLTETRHVVTWLPPGYDESGDTHYKVIYMHDGQNLFDPRLSYTNVDWGVDEAMMQGAKDGLFEPAIIVGIWNTASRLSEYSPDHEGKQYARFIIEELMPKVESTYRVKTGPENTFTMGSSMGGLISFHLVRAHPDTFSACGCVSTHVVWSEQQYAWFKGEDPSAADPIPFVLKSLAERPMPKGQRLFFDYGTEGVDATYEVPTASLVEWLETQNYQRGKNLRVKKILGADHSESAWRQRVSEQLEWLLGTK